MKYFRLFLIIFSVLPNKIHANAFQLPSALAKNINSTTNEDCDFNVYAPVTGKDKHCYLNKCWAEKKGVKISKVGFKKKYYKIKDVYTWPIENVCTPSEKEQPKITNLEDGTFLYKYADKEFRGTQNRCRCLPSSTQILTSKSSISIDQLKEKDSILTMNLKGKISTMPIKLINKVLVSHQHTMIILDLADGRKLQVTPEHPSAIPNKTIDEFEIGELFDGSKIINKLKIDYKEEYTYDILPEGETGFYWANGILIGSTLFNYDRLISEKLNK